MGRKRLTKECTRCNTQCERKQFSRTMWEKDEEEQVRTHDEGVPAVVERTCRQCHLHLKKSNEDCSLSLLPSSSSVVAKQVPVDFLNETFLSSSPLALGSLPSSSTLLNAAQAAMPPPPPLALHLEDHDNNNDDDDFDNGLFDDFDLFPPAPGGQQMMMEDGDEKEKRSVRAKRRRAKMNSLFSALATDVGLTPYSDRARVLERTREVLRDLRQAKKLRTMEYSMASSSSSSSGLQKPIVSILDVVSEHQNATKTHVDIVTHSPCA